MDILAYGTHGYSYAPPSGMTKTHAAKIFSLDEKTSTKGTNGETGTGLGLPLSQNLLEKNGGNIWTETAEGVGSTFLFRLPLSQS